MLVFILEEKKLNNEEFEIVAVVSKEETANLYIEKEINGNRRWSSKWVDDINFLLNLVKG